MLELVSLRAIMIITKLYTAYAYSLAFIFQSSIVLIMALATTVMYVFLKQRKSGLHSSTSLLKCRKRC